MLHGNSRNSDIHRELGVETVIEVIKNSAISQQRRLEDNVNMEGAQLVAV